ncbi:uncharacterized protein LOC130452871 isoform X1 [Diorhabda sublineata]|uniref:uncharacterized protein LOC130452871 isoform X1 n=2 Tax=Diorhabda sublineata TaxID=1163346 RepID=UPI0024E08653|nr:uncharacterized protein LOC130452871 isoform X1 [Diorhabda sublineata]
MIIFLWMLFFSYLWDTNYGYVEIVETQGCDTCKLMLTCRHLTDVIAILKVDFVGIQSNGIFEVSSRNNTFVSVINPPTFPPVHPRDVLNARCSGLNHCSFIFSEDCPGSEIFGRGNITIEYACITQDRIHNYCNDIIQLSDLYAKGLSDGYIHNPGYPRFYSGPECKWKIVGQDKQRIKITILDIALIVDRPNCADVLEIKDTEQVIYSTCRQEHPPSEIISGTESIEIVLKSTQTFNPRRGVFIHYTAIGCPDIEIPQDAYLIYRNINLMVFSCCLGYTFPDTRTRIKTVGCQGALWNTTLPLSHCQKSTTPYWKESKEIIRIFPSKEEDNMASELVLPATLVVCLFAINAVVIFFIYRAKKRQEVTDVKEEELNSFTHSSPVV